MNKIIWAASATAIIAATGLVALGLKNSRAKSQELLTEQIQARQVRNAENAENLDSAISRARREVKPDREPAAIERQPLARLQGLADYAKLKQLIFMSADMRSRKNELLKDERFLRELGALLKTAAMDDLQTQELQSQAIDLLVEARTVADGRVAGEVLKSVVEDSSIENETLSLADRRALAGLKAELLYQWTAQEPKVADSVGSWLPGPISQKIWRNVLAAQEQNEFTSSEESRASDTPE